MQGHKFHKTHK